jgi:hypothetical protein
MALVAKLAVEWNRVSGLVGTNYITNEIPYPHIPLRRIRAFRSSSNWETGGTSRLIIEYATSANQA